MKLESVKFRVRMLDLEVELRKLSCMFERLTKSRMSNYLDSKYLVSHKYRNWSPLSHPPPISDSPGCVLSSLLRLEWSNFDECEGSEELVKQKIKNSELQYFNCER